MRLAEPEIAPSGSAPSLSRPNKGLTMHIAEGVLSPKLREYSDVISLVSEARFYVLVAVRIIHRLFD